VLEAFVSLYTLFVLILCGLQYNISAASVQCGGTDAGVRVAELTSNSPKHQFVVSVSCHFLGHSDRFLPGLHHKLCSLT